jgi:hypothetical protein
MNSGVTFDGVEFVVLGRDDKVEGEMTGKSARSRLGGDWVVGESLEKVPGPLFGTLTYRFVGTVLVRHEHIVGWAGDERGKASIDDRSVGTPFCESA